MIANAIERLPQKFVESLPYSVPLVLMPFPVNLLVVGSVATIITVIQIAKEDRSLSLYGRVTAAVNGLGFYFTIKGVEQLVRSIFSASFLGSCGRLGLGFSSFGIGVATLIVGELFGSSSHA